MAVVSLYVATLLRKQLRFEKSESTDESHAAGENRPSGKPSESSKGTFRFKRLIPQLGRRLEAGKPRHEGSRQYPKPSQESVELCRSTLGQYVDRLTIWIRDRKDSRCKAHRGHPKRRSALESNGSGGERYPQLLEHRGGVAGPVHSKLALLVDEDNVG